MQETTRAAAARASIEAVVNTAMAAFETARVQAAAAVAQAEERNAADAEGFDTLLTELRESVLAGLQAELVNALAQQAEEAVRRESMQVHVTFNIQVSAEAGGAAGQARILLDCTSFPCGV
jgi:hypothetical protein